MGKNHADRELRVFRQFLAARGIAESTGALEKRQPPEPDLLFRYPDGSIVAYELVELLDETHAGMIGLLSATYTALRTQFENLPPDRKALFERNYGDALLYFRFSQFTTLNKRRNVLALAFDKLLALPSGVTGEVLSNDPEFGGTLFSVSVSRSFGGPSFDPESIGWIGDPTVPNIKQKFEKTYDSSYPIELLAYIDGNPMFPDDVWLGNLMEFVDSQPKPFPFRWLWVFDCRKTQVRFQCSGV